jgi:uncharacterized membrane protein YqjE
MLHPLLSVLVRRPDLVVDHLAAYGTLVHEEACDAGEQLLQRGVAWAIAVLCAVLFLMLGGTALMLGLLLDQFHWVLVGVPAIMLVAFGLAVIKARQSIPSARFQELKAQLDRDVQALRTAN